MTDTQNVELLSGLFVIATFVVIVVGGWVVWILFKVTNERIDYIEREFCGERNLQNEPKAKR